MGASPRRGGGQPDWPPTPPNVAAQVYLGGYEEEKQAAEAYDLAAIKSKGQQKAKTNFPMECYSELLPYIQSVSQDEMVMAVRRQSQGFSRGSSHFRGVTHHPNGRWEARIGMPGSKHMYLGLYDQEEEAARVYDRALVRLRGAGAATNFNQSFYTEELAEYEAAQTALLQAVATEARKSLRSARSRG